jgi:hypothetical protein
MLRQVAEDYDLPLPLEIAANIGPEDHVRYEPVRPKQHNAFFIEPPDFKRQFN